MKPAPFEYVAPTDVMDVCDVLAQYGDDAKILAGGQSLMPLINMRLARPRLVVDINRLATLAYITPTKAGGLHLGALTRQRAIERHPLVQATQPLLAAAMPLIGHVPIRNRGTLGGSLVHADPAAELPAVCVALEAECVVQSAMQKRLLPAQDFFLTYLTTALEADEILTEVRLPAWQPAWGWDIQEVCHRAGDFALVGAVAVLHVAAHDVCHMARLVFFGVGERPLRLPEAEAVLQGQRLQESVLADVAHVVTTTLQPDSDIHASATYRQEVGGVLARRVLTQAWQRARQEGTR